MNAPRPAKWSLKARVLAGVGAIAISLALVGIAVIAVTRSHLISQIDTQLQAAASQPRDIRAEPHELGDNEDDAGGLERLSMMYEGILRADGTQVTVFASNLPGEKHPIPAITVQQAKEAHGAFTVGSSVDGVRYRTVLTPRGSDWVIHALPLTNADDTLSQLVWLEIAGVGFALAVLATVGYWVIHHGVRPIREMTLTADRIASGDLDARVDEPNISGAEAGQLASALNTMMGRIGDALDEQSRSEAKVRRFVADASHELRTPLTTIRGYAELYRHGGLSSPDALADAMRRTESEATRMGRLVADMLTLAKLDQERPLSSEMVDMGALANDAAADARVAAPERTIKVTVAGPAVVVGDKDRLHQVVANLVSNALVHTPPGSPVDVAVRRQDASVEVAVTDHGPGMDADTAARISERFFRADPSRSRARGGSGLGMSIVDGVVTAHGGELTVESEMGVGTTVTVVLPAAA